MLRTKIICVNQALNRRYSKLKAKLYNWNVDPLSFCMQAYSCTVWPDNDLWWGRKLKDDKQWQKSELCVTENIATCLFTSVVLSGISVVLSVISVVLSVISVVLSVISVFKFNCFQVILFLRLYILREMTMK